MSLPYQNHSATSYAAAKVAELEANTKRSKLLAFLLRQGATGATDEEMQRFVPMTANTQRPRRVELVQRGLVRESGKLRETTAGVLATVWVAE